jgi:hypothetical protein
VDAGIEPLAHFVDAAGPDAAAVTIETDDRGDIHPAMYLRRSGQVVDHEIAGDAMLDFTGRPQQDQVSSILRSLLPG